MAKSKHNENVHTRGRKRNKKTINVMKIIRFIVLIMIIASAVSFAINMHKDKLYGSWTTDGVTIYRFNGKGKGALVTSLSRYEFTYKIKKNNLYIDFLSDKAKDANYEFSVEKDKLIVKGIDQTKGSYTMTKQK